MLLYHSLNTINQMKHLVENVQQRTDHIVYATPYPQNDYGKYMIRFDAEVSDDETYDQGGISVYTGNIAIPAYNIRLNTMEVFD